MQAPYAGTVVARQVDEGQVIGVGAPVYRFLEEAALEARVGVPPSVADALGTGARVELAAGSGGAARDRDLAPSGSRRLDADGGHRRHLGRRSRGRRRCGRRVAPLGPRRRTRSVDPRRSAERGSAGLVGRLDNPRGPRGAARRPRDRRGPSHGG
ncbi:MAG: HlyD family secretion protein [Myxococcales bacterium]|nr:HlyD family secretion protein [Myxococcales bacterium]